MENQLLKNCPIIFIVFALKICFVYSQQTTNGKGTRMSFKPPQLSDEEERSPHMPAYLACDACSAVTIQLENGLKHSHRHISMDKNLKQWDVIEALEMTCRYETFE